MFRYVPKRYQLKLILCKNNNSTDTGTTQELHTKIQLFI